MGCSIWRRRVLRARIGRGHAMAPQREDNAVAEGVGACVLQTSAVTAAREGSATDSPAGRFDFSGAPDPQSGAPNPRSYGLPCAAPPLPHLRPMREWTTADVPGSPEGASHEGTWQTQIDLRDRPCRIHPRCGHLSLPGAPSLLGRDPPYSSSIPPRLSPPTSTHPSVRLHRTMSLCGTHRVCVPECPPLGRPSF